MSVRCRGSRSGSWSSCSYRQRCRPRADGVRPQRQRVQSRRRVRGDTDEDRPPAAAPRARSTAIRPTTASPGRSTASRRRRTHHLPLAALRGRRTGRPGRGAARVLLEFSPVLCGRRLYLLKNNGALYAISRATGARELEAQARRARRGGSPACSHGDDLRRPAQAHRGTEAGRVVAVSAKHGRTRWSRKLPSRAESSPLIDRGRLFIGTEDGTVYALQRQQRRGPLARQGGRARSRARSRSPTGKLYFGDYGGRVHAIRRSDGRKVWETTPSSGPLGLGDGQLLLVGRRRLRARLHRQHERQRLLAVERRRQARVEPAAPAATSTRRRRSARCAAGRPTVYIGSYDGRFYALDARTRTGRAGCARWARRSPAPRRSSATSCSSPTSARARRGRWARAPAGPSGRPGAARFNPAISDGRRIYFTALHVAVRARPADRPFDPNQPAPDSSRPTTKAQRQAARSASRRASSARAAAPGSPPPRRPRGAGGAPCPRAQAAPDPLPHRAARAPPLAWPGRLPSPPPRLRGAGQDQRADAQPLPHARAALSVRRGRRCRRRRGAPWPRARERAVVEDRRRQRGVGAGVQRVGEVLERAGAARRDDRHADGLGDRAREREVVAVVRAVARPCS